MSLCVLSGADKFYFESFDFDFIFVQKSQTEQIEARTCPILPQFPVILYLASLFGCYNIQSEIEGNLSCQNPMCIKYYMTWCVSKSALH